MFVATSEKRSHDGASQTCSKDRTGPGSKVKKKTRSPEVTFPPLCSEHHPARLLFSRTPVLSSVPSDRPLSVVELPRLIAQVGPGRAVGDTKWTEGPQLMASALGIDFPIRPADELTTQSLTEKDESIKVTTCEDKKITTLKKGKATKPNKVPLSGTEVVHIFANKRDPGELELYYLKEVDGDSFRPYELRVVQSSEAGSEHYIFTPHTVLHVTETGHGGLVSLAEWHRESVTWNALQEIQFFRDFRRRKAFTRWRRNVRKIFFQRRCEELQDLLLIVVPQFRNALFLFTSVIEELKGTHRLPQDESKTFTLLEFKSVLTSMNRERLHSLEKLSQHRAVILNVVREESYKAHQELQLHMEYSRKPSKCSEPIHLHLAHQQQLKRALARSESILQKLGNFAALVNQMTVQSLVTVVRQDVVSFFDNIVKRTNSQQCCFFHTELCFSADNQLTVNPPIRLFQQAVSEVLLTVNDSMIQMCETCGFFLEISSQVFTSDDAQDLTSDLSCVEHHTISEENKSSDGPTGCRRVCCWRSLRDESAGWMLLPNERLLTMHGRRVHGCYYPLHKRQLQWHICINDATTQAEKEQADIMQEAGEEIQQLCESYSWLVDIHLFVSQWSQTSLEAMKGQSALLYEEHIKKVHHWTERIHTVPSSVSSNQLFIIQCDNIKDSLGQQLRSIAEEVLEQLVEQIKLLSDSLISDMERVSTELNTDPRDLHDLSKYSVMTRESVKMKKADMQKHLEYIHSLQETLRINYRKMNEQEMALEQKMLDTWDRFIPLLKRAEIIVCQRLPPAVNAVDTMFSFLSCDLKNTASKATSGRFLDPTQNAKEMVSELNYMCVHKHSLNAKLEQLSQDSENLHAHPMHLTSLTSDLQKVKSYKELWELIALCTTWTEEWKQLVFSEVVVSEAQGRIAKWKEQALSLTSVIPTHDAVLQEALGILERLSHQVAVVAKLKSPTLKQRHWKDIFKGLGRVYVPEKKVTVGELMSEQLEEVNQKLITKIHKDAQKECNMEQTFQKLRQGWEARLFQLDEFTLPVWQHHEPQHGLTETGDPAEGTASDLQTDGQHACNDTRFTIIGLEVHFADIESDLMSLSTMLTSPHSAEFRLQMEDWVQTLQDLGKLLCVFERYQQVWAFLTKMFQETSFSVQRVDLWKQFQPADETFKEIMRSISTDPHVLNFVHSKKTNGRFHGNSLYQILIDGLSTMEAISNQMVDLLENLCDQFPRLWFLSDREVIELLSFQPTPFTLQRVVCKCFKGIRWLEVDCEIPSNTGALKSRGATPQSHGEMKVLGFVGSFQEHISFPSPLETNLNALVWLSVFEKQLKLTMVQLMKQCAVVRNQLESSSQDVACDEEDGDIRLHIAERRKMALPELDLLSEYPLQCLLVAEEAVWCRAVLQAFQESNPVKLSNMKACNSAKLKNLGRSIRDGIRGAKSQSLVSKYTMMCQRALVQLTIKHAQQLSRLMEVPCKLESSFEWHSLIKYHIKSERLKGSDDPTCYVDVLDQRLQYDYEYFGPDDWAMVHSPATDRAMLGILLALTSYRCGFVSGPCMSGKKMTVFQLGKALGRLVVSMQCCPSVRAGDVQRMLLGALQTGAWLLLDSVDLVTQGVLSLLGQHLVDIHQSFSDGLSKNKNQRVNEDRTTDGVKGCRNIDSECRMVLAGRSISASPSYGCVLVSSKEYTSIPENLQCATRPIALSRPDYSIIAEVMLASIGFSEATSLSRRLVALISLAKGSLCLPDFITDDKSCLLVVLQKIISASEIYFQQSVGQQGISDETEGASAEQDVHEKDRKESEKASRLRRSHLLIKQGLMEETAIVKAVLSVICPVLNEPRKASEFNVIFKDTFPIVCQFPLFQQYIEEEEKIQLQGAVTEELQRKWFHSDTELTSRALTLYQTLKFSSAVILLGPSGSGKTSGYCALAGALSHLAAKTEEYNEKTIGGDKTQISTATWASVDNVVLFPNAMSFEELFGSFCEKRGWQDGAVGKVLRDSERPLCNEKKKRCQTQRWLVMDGNPVGQPRWLDYLTILCSPENPFLCLSSGETLPSQTHLKLLMEVTDLRDASPSAVTRCSLVYFTGADLWKTAWRSEVDALSVEYKLDLGTLNMWNRLAEDLFSSTLSLLRQKALTSAIHNEGEALHNITYGLQEITSFVRILRALLQRFGKDVETIPQTAGTDSETKQDLMARNLFLVAYIWGFGGHLHPRHWPQFDSLTRQGLFACRYKIVVPDEESVFEHFLNIDRRIQPKNTLLTKSISPKYGSYTFVLNLMLEANQPVLLAGEPASGKTTLCRTLLSIDKPHMSLPVSPLLSSRDLRTILDTISCQKSCRDALGSMIKQPRLLLFLDDLHEAPCDVFEKTSAALETLRQSISTGQILTFDGYNFKLLSAAAISYMATCCIFGSANHHSTVISSRLSRLFSIIVLPSLSMDVILSIHSPPLKSWLKEMPLQQSGEDMACCIITATKNLYHAVCDQFQLTVQTPHFMFSHHDLQTVFKGMCLWQPNIPNTREYSVPGFPPVLPGPASVLNIAHIWMHECIRTFGDRLSSEDENKDLVSLIAKTATAHYGVRLVDETQTLTSQSQSLDALNLPQEPQLAGQSNMKKGRILTEPSLQPLQPRILQHMEDVLPKLVYGPEFSEASMNQQHNFKCSSYQGRDLDVLLQELCALINRKEEDKGREVDVTTRFIVHRRRVSQLLHVLRVLLIPGGHGVLIGSDRGTGRKTTVRFAAYLTGDQLMEVHPGNENKLHEILKEAGNQARADGVNVIVLVHEGISPSAREQLLVAMAHRSYPGLHTDQELRDLLPSRVTAVRNSRRYQMDSWMFEKFLSQSHRNVHVFLLLPFTTTDATNGPRRWNAQLTKALSNSCCVEVYQPWSNQALLEVAAQCLKTSRLKMWIEGSEASLAAAMAGIHQSAYQYASVLLTAQPFSPQTYLEFIAHFGFLCNHLHEQQQSQAYRIDAVLSRLDVMNNTAVQCKQNLMRLQEKVAETQQREDDLLRAVDHQRSRLDEGRQKCVLLEKKLHHLEEQIDHAQKQVGPVFLAGLKIINCLNPSDLEEVRHYRDPPDGVVRIMDAICLLFNRPPGWESAKQLLGQTNFFQELEFFDRYSLTDEQMQQLGQIVHSPQFVPESVLEVSKACESLCRWVQAVYECCCMQNQLLVKQQLEVLDKKTQGQLLLARQHEEEADRHLEEVKIQLQLVRTELEEELLELHIAESSERDAAAAVEQLETHDRDWRAAAQEAALRNQTLSGDSLMLAATISYLGPFGPDVRTELLSKWRELCQTGSININPEDPRTSLFTHSDSELPHPPLGFPILVSERLPLGRALGLLDDASPARMVVKLLLWGCRRSWVQRWPLLADAQQHLDISSQRCLITGGKANLEEETKCQMVLRADDPQLLDKLDQAAEKGLGVLVTDVERVNVGPQFLARLGRSAGCFPPELKQSVQLSHPDFFLFLSTHLPVQRLNSEIHPSILAQVHVVDLSLSSEEIQELMLTQLLQTECKNLLIQHLQFQNDKQLLQKKLVSEEDALMDYILQSNTSLLQDSAFLPRVAVCQEATKELQAEIQQLNEELQHHDSLLAATRQLMRLAAAFHQALQEVTRLSPAYYFSLRGFITVIQEAFIVKDRPLVSCTVGKVPEGIIPEVMNRMVAQLLGHYRPCLFKSHVSVLEMLLSVALLQHNQLCSEAERMAFIRGLQDIQHPVTQVCSLPPVVSQSTSALPSWIPPHIHPELLCLDKIPVFRGLISSLCSFPIQWQEYLHFPSSTVAGPVPCRSHSHLSLLQRALLWKTMIPSCLEGLAEAMAAYHLAGTEARHARNPEALSRYLVKHEGPVILTVPSQRGDERTSIQPLHLINRLASCVAETQAQVKVISFGALCDGELILSTLDEAVNEGFWLVFNNCHLLDQWDSKVLTHLSQLISSSREERRLIHPFFRLWFISQEHASHSIPAAVRMCALPLVCESVGDLKEELSCCLQQLMSVVQCQSLSADNMELLLCCAIFHSVLLQRQTYKHSDQGRIYSWSQDDLLALVDAHICVASSCHNKAEALQYIAVNLVHGGHVLDSADLEVVDSVAKTFLSRVSPLWGSGPHVLSDITSNPGRCDSSKLLQKLEQDLQDSSIICDPHVLSFSSDEIIQINSQNLNTLLQTSQTPPGAVRSLFNQPATLPNFSHARDTLQALRSFLCSVPDAAAVPPGPLGDFLQAEWEDLTDSVSSLLSQLQYSTPTFVSLLKLTDLSLLERRAELLSAYLWRHHTSDPLGAYRLSAFRNARGFLVAVMREAARVNRRYLSDIALHVQVLSDGTFPASLALDAVYLCGLQLRGASWDTQLGALQETVSLQPCTLPLVCVKAHISSTDTFTCKSSHLYDVQVVHASPSTAPQLPLYGCPLYLDGERENNIITTLPLHTKLDPVLCSLRRVKLVSLL